MGNIPPKAKTPLRCILENWDQFDPQTLRNKRLIFFCSAAWPRYPLQGREMWPPEGSINYNTILQLNLFCRKKGKWSEVPYVQTFFSLRDNLQLCKKCDLCPKGSPQSLPPYPSVPLIPSPTNKDLPSTQTVQKEIDKGVNNEPKHANIPRLCPLQAVGGGEFSPARVNVSFSLSDLKQIKIDLGKFSDNPDGYIHVLQGLGQSFDLIWRDIMLLLDQTVTPNERSATITAAREFGDLWYLSQVSDRMITEERERFPIGQQAVSSVDPHWDTESEHGDWCCRHSLTCMLEGLRKTRKKPMNYSMMSTITQGRKENPTAFLERLREALRKHTSLSPDSIEGQLILKDKFITQSAADIRKKLQKQYPLRPEAQQRLQKIVKDLKAKGLVKLCNCPCNTPILGVQKPNGQWRIKAVKLQMALQMELQMQSMTKIYCGPLDRPASPCSNVNDIEGIPPEEISTA
nr:uncharacterized protein LOC129051703 [Pongo abelii]